jgi:glycosyltransferase involved in cell wall biosynthesis
MPHAEEYVGRWSADEHESLLLGKLEHDEFLTLLSRCFAYVPTPACDGVSASVLESLALGIPVIASENGSRPPGVITYPKTDPESLCARMLDLLENRAAVRERLSHYGDQAANGNDNVGRMADWLAGESVAVSREEVTHAV